ncbi:MAG: hypothetical protein LBT07_02820 [Endomicrobium sp.]|nr:hypothetical protein [Endomicrobium sp.]
MSGKDAEITKEIPPCSNSYNAAYEIENNSSEILNVSFALEQIFAFSSKIKDDFCDLESVDS